MFFQKFKSRATLTSSLNRISELGSKILTFGKIKQKQAFFLLFRSLNRISELRSKILTFGKTQINLLFRSLNRIFADGNNVFTNWKPQIVS